MSATIRLGRRGLTLALASLAVSGPRRARADGPVVLSRFDTSYLTDAPSRSRAFNVELAARCIDGVSLASGKVFSFNGVVGERTAAFGFEQSTVLRDRAVAEGMGGGICQVASTLHAAALLAGLEIVSRAPHSRPSRYIRMGLDATVVYPKVDLQIRNQRDDRVVISARAAKGSLVVSVGAASGGRPHVTLVSEILERTRYVRTLEHDPTARPNVIRIKDHGIPGYRVLCTREVTDAEGVTRRHRRVDVYPPTPALLIAPPGLELPAPRSAADTEPFSAEDEAASAAQGPAPEVRFVDDPTERPVHIQLHPMERVVLDNTRS
jgi:hypothetical protein